MLNIRNYKKTVFWLVIVSIIIFAGTVIGLTSNPTGQKVRGDQSLEPVYQKVNTVTQVNIQRLKAVASDDVPVTKDLEQSISQAILSYSADSGMAWYETAGEGHNTLETEEKEGMTYAYILEMYAQFGLENGILTELSGHANPSTLVFQKDGSSNYILKEFLRPVGNLDELQEMFSESALKKFNAADQEKNSIEMNLQVEAYAKAYLEKIGSEANIQR